MLGGGGAPSPSLRPGIGGSITRRACRPQQHARIAEPTLETGTGCSQRTADRCHGDDSNNNNNARPTYPFGPRHSQFFFSPSKSKWLPQASPGVRLSRRGKSGVAHICPVISAVFWHRQTPQPHVQRRPRARTPGSRMLLNQSASF